jgi:hypothetical protein
MDDHDALTLCCFLFFSLYIIPTDIGYEIFFPLREEGLRVFSSILREGLHVFFIHFQENYVTFHPTTKRVMA